MQWFSDPAWQSRIYSAVNCNSAVAVYNHNLRVCAVCKSIVSTYVHTTLRTFYTNYNYSLTTLHVERARSLSTFTTSNPSQDLLSDSGISNTPLGLGRLLLKLRSLSARASRVQTVLLALASSECLRTYLRFPDAVARLLLPSLSHLAKSNEYVCVCWISQNLE